HRLLAHLASINIQQCRFPKKPHSDGIRATTKPQEPPQVSSMRKLARASSSYFRGAAPASFRSNGDRVPVDREFAVMYTRRQPREPTETGIRWRFSPQTDHHLMTEVAATAGAQITRTFFDSSSFAAMM